MYFRFSNIKVKETKAIWPFEEEVSRERKRNERELTIEKRKIIENEKL